MVQLIARPPRGAMYSQCRCRTMVEGGAAVQLCASLSRRCILLSNVQMCIQEQQAASSRLN